MEIDLKKPLVAFVFWLMNKKFKDESREEFDYLRLVKNVYINAEVIDFKNLQEIKNVELTTKSFKLKEHLFLAEQEFSKLLN